MKSCLIGTVLLFAASSIAFAQEGSPEVVSQMKRFHELMVQNDSSIHQYIDDSLSYGHSGGMVETKNDFLSNLKSRIDYHSIREDSVSARVHGKVANVRFVGVYDSTFDGKRAETRLKVLEVWVKKKKGWKIFARQAVRQN
jgi:hypothetical protein